MPMSTSQPPNATHTVNSLGTEDMANTANTAEPLDPTATIGAGFAAARADYHQHAYHQRQLADVLAQQVAHYAASRPVPNRALEIGCGTGFLTASLQQHWRQAPIQTYWLNDLAISHNHIAPPPAAQVHSLIGDIAHIALPHRLDLVLSSSALQWVDNLPQLIQRLHSHLAPDALIAIGLYCGAHYQELSATLGVGLRYWQVPDLQALLHTHFTCLWQQEVRDTYYFAQPRAVLKHVRDTGVAHLHDQLRFTALRQFPQAYAAWREARGYPLTYHAYQFIGQLKRT